jgi:hypothetical protein
LIDDFAMCGYRVVWKIRVVNNVGMASMDDMFGGYIVRRAAEAFIF